MLLQTYNHLSNWFSAILLISPAWSIWTTSLSTPNLRTHTIVWLDRFWNGLGVQSFMQILRSVNSTKTPWNVQINPKKLNTILNWLILTSIKEIQQFVGFCSFNWCIIQTSSCLYKTLLITQPISSLILYHLRCLDPLKCSNQPLHCHQYSGPLILCFHLP